MCGTCYEKQLFAEDPARREKARVYRKKYKQEVLRNNPGWVKQVQIEDRRRGAVKRGDPIPGSPRHRTDVPCGICGTFPCVAKNMCQRCYNRERMRHLRRTNPVLVQNQIARTAAHVKENGLAVLAAKQGPCVDCGGRFPPECMDFDHIVERGPKLFNISKAGGRNVEGVLAEIAKCDLICANCHRTRSRARTKALGRNGMA
jgi:hypothetical protein